MYYATTPDGDRSRYANKAELEQSFDMTPDDYRLIREGRTVQKSTGVTECAIHDPKAVKRHNAPPEPVEPVQDVAPAVSDDVGLNAKAKGGSTIRQEVAWALDAVKRGDKDLAVNRLKRILASA